MADKTLSKKEKDDLIAMLRKGPVQMQRLRHPSILRVVAPLCESKDFLAFATEQVIASLANILGKIENLPQVRMPHMSNRKLMVKVTRQLKEFELQDIEISLGLIQISEALAFCHSEAQLIHGAPPSSPSLFNTSRQSDTRECLRDQELRLEAGRPQLQPSRAVRLPFYTTHTQPSTPHHPVARFHLFHFRP